MVKDGVHKVIAEAKKLGFAVSKTRGDHWKFSRPDPPPVFFSSTPSDARAFKNGLAKLRRAATSIPQP